MSARRFARQRIAQVAVGRPQAHGLGPLGRVCPKCGSKAGHRCTRTVAGTGEEIVLKSFHKERRAARHG